MNIDYDAVTEILKKFISNEKVEILGISVGEERQVRDAIKNLLTAYEREKEKNSKAIGHIEACKTSLGNYILSPNETEYLLSILKEE